MIQKLFNKLTKADVLIFSAFIVAAPRFMGVFAAVIGQDITDLFPSWIYIETFSGIFQAMLEGVALAYIAKHWRRLDYQDQKVYWIVLAAVMAILLASFPLIVTPYFMSVSQSIPVVEVLPYFLFILWNGAVATINPLVVIAVGIVDEDFEQSGGNKTNSNLYLAGLDAIAIWYDTNRYDISPRDLIASMNGYEVTIKEAEDIITKAEFLGIIGEEI